MIVTRGNVNLNPILESLPFDDVVIYDNATRGWDLSVYGRYAGIDDALRNVIYVQDDDCVLEPEAFVQLLDAYEPGHLVCNMPERFLAHYSDSALVGFGAIFNYLLPRKAFDRFFAGDAHKVSDADFFRTCDVVFTALTPRVLVDAPYRNLPWAEGADRMYRTEGHVEERTRMLELARAVRDGIAA